MKQLWMIGCVLGIAAPPVFAQGTIDLVTANRNGGFVAPIFQLDPANPFFEEVGQPSTAVYSGALPTGTVRYGGLPVTSAYDLVLLYSLNSSATSVSQMSVATIVPFRTAAVATAVPAGTIINVSTLAIPGTTGGTAISFAIGAFFVDQEIANYVASNPSATVSDIYANAYADFQFDFIGQMGWGQIVPNIVLGGSDTTGALHPEPSTEEGWTSFDLFNVAAGPEPSTWLLSIVGAALVMAKHRFGARLRPTRGSN